MAMSEQERSWLIAMLAENPQAGNAISGTGGMRKVRVAAGGKGKSGGYRVITFFSGKDIPVFLITAYAKNQKETITDQEKRAFKTMSDTIIKTYKERKEP